MELAISRYLDVMAELNALQEMEGITAYHEKFELICGDIAFSEPYMVSVYLFGLQPDTQENVRLFRPQSIRHCLLIGRLYESAHPCKPKEVVEEFLQLPKNTFSEVGHVELSTILALDSAYSKDLANTMDDTCLALGELPINLDEDADSCANPEISASGTTNCKEPGGGEQFTREFEVSIAAQLSSLCVSSDLSELPQPSICVSSLDEHVPAVQVISIPLFTGMNLSYIDAGINRELRVDVMDCGIDELIERTNWFHMSLNQVTLSYASKVFDKMPSRNVGLRSEELCPPAVHTLILQASSNGSCTLWHNICRLVFEPGGVRALFDHSLPWNLRQVVVEMMLRCLQWDPGDPLIAGSELLFHSWDALIVFRPLLRKSLEDHNFHLAEVFNLMRECCLFAKQSNCALAASRVEYLGHSISQHDIATEPARVNAVPNGPFLSTYTNSEASYVWLAIIANLWKD